MKQATIQARSLWTLPWGCVPAGARTLALPAETRRSRRVLVLVLGIIVLSLADLVVTVAYLQANWMVEANPIAAWIIRHTQSPWPLALFKVCTVTVCVTLLYRLRRYRSGEAAAWCAVGVLAVMSAMWRGYAEHFDGSEPHLMDIALAYEDGLR